MSVCVIDGCDRTMLARGWCNLHYLRWYRTGSTDDRRDPMRRLLAKIEVAPSGCWEWTASRYLSGYGEFGYKGRSGPAHRASYELHVGPIPEGMYLDHLCRNRGCVNPEHLEPVTPRENVLRSPLTIARQNADKTHCPRGHPYDYRLPSGGRVCRRCTTERMRRFRARRKAA